MRFFFQLIRSIISAVFVPFALFVLVIKPIKEIRVGYFIIDRIGHLVFDVEQYLLTKKDGITRDAVDFFFFQGESCNDQFLKMIKRHVKVHWWIQFLFRALEWLPRSEKTRLEPGRITNGSRDKEGLFSKYSSQLSFLPEEEEEGRRYLKRCGVEGDRKFICLLVRDDSYLGTLDKRDWSYHAYRDSPIIDYVDCALALAHRGYTVFRMGKVVNEQLPVKQPDIIDYANSSDRSDFLDIWLMANCQFCVSTATGLDNVALVFRRPIVFVNLLPLGDMLSWHRNLVVPKYLYWKTDGHYLSLRECLENNYHSSFAYEKAGIGIKNLQPNEITKAALEMDDRLAGEWFDTETIKSLQTDFWSAMKQWAKFSEYHRWIHPEARIGSDFIQTNQDWFLA